jgi:hypothetical protein
MSIFGKFLPARFLEFHAMSFVKWFHKKSVRRISH